MATFDDFRNVMEDTIRVDMKKRWTPQLVKFINNKNEFYGFFNGNINATSGSLTDVSLSNVTIYNQDGSELDLNTVIETIDNINDLDFRIIDLSNIINNDIPL